jgi:hypothetical protein
MQGRALVADRDIAEQRQDFDLLVDGYLLVLLRFPLEIPEDGAAECADRGGARRASASCSRMNLPISPMTSSPVSSTTA